MRRFRVWRLDVIYASSFLIPLFVGIGLAALAAGLASSGWSGSSDVGGGSAAAPAVAPTAQESQVIGPEDPEPEAANLGLTGVLNLVDEQGENFMSWAVRQTKDGRGDGGDVFAIVGT